MGADRGQLETCVFCCELGLFLVMKMDEVGCGMILSVFGKTILTLD